MSKDKPVCKYGLYSHRNDRLITDVWDTIGDLRSSLGADGYDIDNEFVDKGDLEICKIEFLNNYKIERKIVLTEI